jgi:DNA polymerase-3 subunit delta
MADVDRFFKTIEDDELPPVVAMGGAERAFVDEALGILRERALKGGIPEFNHDRLSGRDVAPDRVAGAARQLPTMAPRRLVEVHDADHLGEQGFDRLKEYLEDPAPETVLVFVFDKVNLSLKLPKLLKKTGLLAKFEHPREREMPQLVSMRARRHKVKLSRDSTEALALTVGTDLVLLERALEKLALVAEGREVELADISLHVADTHLEDAFSLINAVRAGDRAGALRSLGALERDRDRGAPMKLLGLLAWQMRQTVRVRALLDEGAGEDGVGGAMNLRGYRLKEALTAARRHDSRQHERRLMRVAATDRALKSSRVPMWRWIERLVLELCPERRPERRPRR